MIDGTKNGAPTNFDVSNTKYTKEHQNLGGDEPWFGTIPLVQRGGAGVSWTKLRKTTTNLLIFILHLDVGGDVLGRGFNEIVGADISFSDPYDCY
ncbi:hypothetical protein E6C60_0938 [Paenibacillus algicola]|uniref:Uncharacterized protein n=1 Tax=Paenibacillus algicola TaxID=2565926 RepID=A0A4P8XH77_9BACL|nr:hypothetical protein E6C60_0938 [Paenibacillus algicola]